MYHQTQNPLKMEVKNIYQRFLDIVERQTKLSDQCIKIALHHYEEHERLRMLSIWMYERLALKADRNSLEDRCYEQLAKLLIKESKEE